MSDEKQETSTPEPEKGQSPAGTEWPSGNIVTDSWHKGNVVTNSKKESEKP